MIGIELPFLDVRRDRQGRIAYWYVRRTGRLRRIETDPPSEPGSKPWLEEYHRLVAELAPADLDISNMPADRRDFLRGTFGALVNDYLGSGLFKTKKPRTKASYQRLCEALQRAHGSKRVAHLERRHVRQIRDEKADTPGEANNVLRMVKILLNFAVDDGFIQASPAAKFRELPLGEWRDWTDDECAKFERRWVPGTMQRRAYALALFTGQRKSDLITRERSHRRDGGIAVVQSKTDEPLWIPEHRELTAELGRGVAGITYLLTTPTQGKQFGGVYFGSWFAEAIDKAGLPDDCVLHGLRKTAARTLAELGLAEGDIQSITGHVTSRMVAKYVKGANQQKRAKRAMATWENDT